MSIEHNPLDERGITPAGERWKLLPIRTDDGDVVYWDLRGITGAEKTDTNPR